MLRKVQHLDDYPESLLEDIKDDKMVIEYLARLEDFDEEIEGVQRQCYYVHCHDEGEKQCYGFMCQVASGYSPYYALNLHKKDQDNFMTLLAMCAHRDYDEVTLAPNTDGTFAIIETYGDKDA